MSMVNWAEAVLLVLLVWLLIRSTLYRRMLVACICWAAVVYSFGWPLWAGFLGGSLIGAVAPSLWGERRRSDRATHP